jgi:ubiquinone/menaquinone biosynthesis C-methylase UbiE
MNTDTIQEQIAAAKAYEALFVTALFKQWAPMVINAAKVKSGHRVLDVACGTGVLGREAFSKVGSSGYVAGVDIAPGMLEVARRIEPSIDWKQAAADNLPFPDQSFDAVVCQFGLMFFPDAEGSLREMLRVLIPGGHLAVAVFDSLANIPAYADEVALLERSAGKKAADALRAPFALGRKDDLVRLAKKSGVNSINVTTHVGQATFPSIRSLVEADLRGWLPVMGVELAEDKIEEILEEAEHAMNSYVNDNGQAVFPVSAHIFFGSKS